MLQALRLTDYVLFDRMDIEFGEHLNVITGETGAGKSILLGALDLLLGGEASADLIRVGAERAIVEGLFIPGPEVRARLEAAGLDVDDPGAELVLRREISRSGRSRAFVNGAMANLQTLGRIGEEVVEIHGQADNRLLIRQSNQLELLDAFGGLGQRRGAFAGLLAASRALDKRLSALEETLARFSAEQELLRFQLQEIDAAGLSPGEDEALEEELSLLENSEKITELLDYLLQGLDGEAGEGAAPVIDSLGILGRQLELLAGLVHKTRPLAEQLDSARYSLEEVARDLRDLAQSLEFDPQKLQELRARKDQLYLLKKKYGPGLADVLNRREEIAGKLESAGRDETELAGLRGQSTRTRDEVSTAARALSEERRRVAAHMESQVETRLAGLSMADGRFKVEFEPAGEGDGAAGYLTSGADRITFLLSTNPGVPLLPLSRVASGGELSRVMLALKSALAEVESPSTMIFDEVDSGIGGRVGDTVGEYLDRIATRHQVIVVTHLAQIARCADNHLAVEKSERDGRSQTVVRRLSDEDRPREIARMMGGDTDSDLSLAHARQMLERSEVNRNGA